MNTHSKSNKKQKVENTNYFCPMYCEGDKTYDEPGDCPVCGMHLVPVGSGGEHGKHSHASTSHEHAHGEHNHKHEMKAPAQPVVVSEIREIFLPYAL